MATYTSDEQRTYNQPTQRDDNNLAKMALPFLVGLLLGWGANEMMDAGSNNRQATADTGSMQDRPR